MFFTASLISLVLSLLLFTRVRLSKPSLGVFFILVFFWIILALGYGSINYFTGNGIDSATIYHLAYGLSGAGFFEYAWLIVGVVLALVLGAAGLLRFIQEYKLKQRGNALIKFLSFVCLIFSLLLNPASIDVYNLYRNYYVIDTAKASGSSFKRYYKKPYIKSYKEQHKNIVFIYAESLERTYFDQAVFPGLIKGLREIEIKNISFTDIRQVYGAGWTIAGMTASQCGIPLVTTSHGNSMSGMDQFLPSAICLGDLLAQEGYQLEYMAGASLDFAGKGKLYKTHGFSGVLGREELLPRLKDQSYKTGWGLYDDSLFNMVYDRFINLSSSGKRFGLFTLTLDTHHPNGHPSKICDGIKYDDGSNAILNAVACSDFLISNFINKILSSPFADQTTIVLMSDHLAMRNTASSFLEAQNRKNLLMIIDSANQRPLKVKSVGSTLDVSSTLLPFLGFEGVVGLGRNLLESGSLNEEAQFIHDSLYGWRLEISQFWDFPKIHDSVEVDVGREVIKIDDREFMLPILVELDVALQSTLKFEFDRSPEHESLVDHVKSLDTNSYFLLINKCEALKELDPEVHSQGVCFMGGKDQQNFKNIPLSKNVVYSSKEIRNFLGI